VATLERVSRAFSTSSRALSMKVAASSAPITSAFLTICSWATDSVGRDAALARIL
jgi:hypothetical protein